MRRITLWVLSTLSALVLLFGYSTSTSGPQATSAPSSIHASATAGSSDTESSGGSGTTSGSGSTSSGSTSSGGKTVTGSVAQTQWGPVQVQLTVRGGRVTDVSVIQYPNGNGRDQEINSQALPVLTQETIDAQSADIDMVSGATVTSRGYLESLQSALDEAGL
jgi:uncharacterized protein with FMN-binding domain